MVQGDYDETVKITFGEVIPKFLEQVEPYANGPGKFLFGDKLTYADFWVGAMYVDNFSNPNVGFGQGEWEKLLARFPGFDKFGKNFTEEMGPSKYLETRPP